MNGIIRARRTGAETETLKASDDNQGRYEVFILTHPHLHPASQCVPRLLIGCNADTGTKTPPEKRGHYIFMTVLTSGSTLTRKTPHNPYSRSHRIIIRMDGFSTSADGTRNSNHCLSFMSTRYLNYIFGFQRPA